MEEYKNKKLAAIRFIGVGIGLIIVMCIISTVITSVQSKNVYYYSNLQQTSENSSNYSDSNIFSNGSYISGRDFKPGTYDIVALSGSGSIVSSNIYTGGVDNEIASNKEGIYKEFRHIKLPAGTKLTVTGDVNIKLLIENN